jgi:hypothetical protein
MKVYLFTNPAYLDKNKIRQEQCFAILEKMASSSDTSDLVTALYLIRGHLLNRGTAYVRKWMTSSHFTTKRGKWALTSQWELPENLPEKFKLIRIRLDANPRLYPKKELDTYGWLFEYETFYDHLAVLFAHELHHFRRYHLGLHPKEGENGANRWALAHAQSLGFRVRGEKQPSSKRASRFKRRFRTLFDPFPEFRHLKTGDKLIITRDPKNKYLGQHVIVMRPVRSNSKRIVVQTQDHKIWRWPMAWVRIKTEDNA